MTTPNMGTYLPHAAINRIEHEIRQVIRNGDGDISDMDGLRESAAILTKCQAADLCGAALIADERLRQTDGEGHTDEGDDTYQHRELLKAAECYLLYGYAGPLAHMYNAPAPADWPWDRSWWKPHNPIRDLTRAGALIAAEIDRLLRKDGVLGADSHTAPTQPPHAEEGRSPVSKREGVLGAAMRTPGPGGLAILCSPQDMAAFRAVWEKLSAQAANPLYILPADPTPAAPGFNPDMAAAPHDGTPLLLLVDYSADGDHGNPDQENGTDLGVTIGHNSRDHTGEDVWDIAGWDWCHDQYCAGRGTPIGWMHRPAPRIATPTAPGHAGDQTPPTLTYQPAHTALHDDALAEDDGGYNLETDGLPGRIIMGRCAHDLATLQSDYGNTPPTVNSLARDLRTTPRIIREVLADAVYVILPAGDDDPLDFDGE